MERRAQGNAYNIRQSQTTPRYEEQMDSYTTYDQTQTSSYPPNRSNYEATHRNGHSTYPREQGNHDRITPLIRNSHRQNDDDDDDDGGGGDQRRSQMSYRPSVRIPTNDTRQTRSSDQLQNTSRVNYMIPQNSSGNSRSIVLDINISINLSGNRTPQVTATAETLPRRTSPIRSTAILEDMNFIDLDIHTPQRTARLVTDGSIRSSPLQQTPSTPQANPK